MLGDVRGVGLTLERAGQAVAVFPGRHLQAGDVLRTGEKGTAAITFAPEKTRIDVHTNTELRLSGWSHGKQFLLSRGTLTASVARQRPFRPLVISTPQAKVRVLGTKFTLQVRNETTRLEVQAGTVRFERTRDGVQVKVTSGNYSEAADGVHLASLPATSHLLREYWTNYTGNFVQLVMADPAMASHPDGYDYLPSFESQPFRTGLHFGERLRGYLHPPKTGWYRFALAGIGAEVPLLLSRTEKPEDIVQVAFGNAEGTGTDLNNVTPVPLEAGRMYYIESADETVGVGEHLTVTWQRPDGITQVIPGEFLSPYAAPRKKGKS